MFWCCCLRLHRHQLHLVSYGCVSLSLIITGVVFTVFAVFQKDSQIGKVWLAGPVLIVVGAVLCGKVMIDWGPAMERGRAGSVDSRLVDEFGYSNLLSVSGPTKTINLVGRSPEMAQHLKIPVKNSSAGLPPGNTSPLSQVRSLVSPSFSNSAGGQFGPYDCITYGPSPEMPASPCRSSSERREMADKMTQAKEESCEKCATLWAILDRRKTGPPEAAARSPKVIGRFVFSELNNGGPSQQQQQPMANYGAALGESTSSSLQNNHHHHVPHSRQMPAAPRRGTRKKSYAQGETMIMNERSFLI